LGEGSDGLEVLGVDFLQDAPSAIAKDSENHLEGIWGAYNNSPNSHLHHGRRCRLLCLLFRRVFYGLHLLDQAWLHEPGTAVRVGAGLVFDHPSGGFQLRRIFWCLSWRKGKEQDFQGTNQTLNTNK